jgi:Prenyltransferase and squalene oxidase repeat
VALERLQQDGVFPLELWPERPATTPADSLFCTAATLLACGELLPRHRVEAALEVIERRRRPDGHWAWLPDDSLAPDADSTSVALAALIRFGDAPPASAGLLRSYWRVEADCFRTWLHGPLATPERDDAVVNCNVLYCLRLAGEARDAEVAAVRDVVARVPAGTRYYPSPTSLAYAAARAGVLDAEPATVGDGSPSEGLGPLRLAESLAAGRGGWDAVELLLTEQQPDGRWGAAAWFMDDVGAYCSDAYSTAVAVEALSRELDGGLRRPAGVCE